MSLRDVERAMIVFKYFCDKSNVFSELVSEMAEDEVSYNVYELFDFSVFLKDKESVDFITRALILSLSVCYHARLQERAEYEEGVVAQFMAPLDCDSVDIFHEEIKWLV